MLRKIKISEQWKEMPTIYNEGSRYKMSIKKWKNKELSENISKKFGLKMDLDKLKQKSKENKGKTK